VGVIGCGAIGQRRHLPEYKARPDVEIVAVVDTNLRRAQETAKQFGAAQAFGDYRPALKLKLDAVSVCSPTAHHAEHSIAALKAGAHVLCEKPMAASVKEAKAMLAAARAARRELMIGQNQRLHVAHVYGKEMLQSGVLGRPLAFATSFAHPGPEYWSVDGKACHFFHKNQAVWGALADLGVHKLDLIRWLLDDDFVQATAMFGTLQKKKCDVEDTAFCVLRTAKGLLGQVFAGWVFQPGSENSTVIYCEKGMLRLEDDPDFTVIGALASGEKRCIRTKGIQTNEKGGQTGSGVIDGFVDAIQAGKKVPIPGSDVIKSLAAVVACVQSGKTGRTVKVAVV
jgi:predicted dehydrogenase